MMPQDHDFRSANGRKELDARLQSRNSQKEFSSDEKLVLQEMADNKHQAGRLPLKEAKSGDYAKLFEQHYPEMRRAELAAHQEFEQTQKQKQVKTDESISKDLKTDVNVRKEDQVQSQSALVQKLYDAANSAKQIKETPQTQEQKNESSKKDQSASLTTDQSIKNSQKL